MPRFNDVAHNDLAEDLSTARSFGEGRSRIGDEDDLPPRNGGRSKLRQLIDPQNKAVYTTDRADLGFEYLHNAQLLAEHMSELVSLFRSQSVNKVLWSGTVTLVQDPVSALFVYAFDHFSAPFASVYVWSNGAQAFTVAARGREAVLPVNGPGIFTIPTATNTPRWLAVTGNLLTLYSSAALNIALSVHTDMGALGYSS